MTISAVAVHFSNENRGSPFVVTVFKSSAHMISEFKMLIHVIISQAYNVTICTVYTCVKLPANGGSGYVQQCVSCQTHGQTGP